MLCVVLGLRLYLLNTDTPSDHMVESSGNRPDCPVVAHLLNDFNLVPHRDKRRNKHAWRWVEGHIRSDSLWLGSKLCACQTHRPSNKRTHKHTRRLTSGYCVCKMGLLVCVCVILCVGVFPLQAQSDLSRLDLGLFLAWPSGLRHLQRERKGTQ